MNTYFNPCPKVHVKKRSRHISNPKPTAEDYCEFDEGGNACGAPFSELHEVWGGAYRNNSIRFHMQIRLCGAFAKNHHNYLQQSGKAEEYRNKLYRRYQRRFERENPGLVFTDYFPKDYLRG
jgi:hypothetical protein